jgi:hypothetical protein
LLSISLALDRFSHLPMGVVVRALAPVEKARPGAD